MIPNVGSQYNSGACPRSCEDFPGGLCAFNLNGVILGVIEGNSRRDNALRLRGVAGDLAGVGRPEVQRDLFSQFQNLLETRQHEPETLGVTMERRRVHSDCRRDRTYGSGS